MIVDLDSLLGRHPALGGEAGWAGPLSPEACRRLACDGALTRVLISRQPGDPSRRHGLSGDPDHHHLGGGLDGDGGLAARLRTAMAQLPPVLGGAPSQPLDVGRASRVVTPAQRSALAVRDRGCVFPACTRPLSWSEGHHLLSWLDGGPTDLANLALLCRAHHRAVHEDGWQLTRGPDGRFSATHRIDDLHRTGDIGPRPEPAAARVSQRRARSRWPGCSAAWNWLAASPPCQATTWSPNNPTPPCQGRWMGPTDPDPPPQLPARGSQRPRPTAPGE